MLFNLFLWIFCFWRTSEAQPALKPPISIAAVAEGSTFQIVCSGSANLVWKRGPNVVTTKRELVFAKVALSDAGHYECVDDGGISVKFQLLVFQVETEIATFSFREAAKLSCRVVDARSFTYSWKLGDKTPSQLLGSFDESKLRKKANITEHPNGTLEFLNPRREMAGLWSCLAETVEAGTKVTLVQNVAYYAQAYILPLTDPTNTEDSQQPRTHVPTGGSLTLRCMGLGYPFPNISWFTGDAVKIQTDDRYKVWQVGPYLTLSMTDLTWDDEGIYKCLGTSDHFPGEYSNKTAHIRITDRRTVLWGFLAIGGQLLMIVTIVILTGVKERRAAQEEKKMS